MKNKFLIYLPNKEEPLTVYAEEADYWGGTTVLWNQRRGDVVAVVPLSALVINVSENKDGERRAKNEV